MILPLTENNIPIFSLAETTFNQASNYIIKELDGKTQVEKPFFLAPHRRDYYFFALIKEGNSKHWTDMVPYTLKANTFYFTVPHQVHLKESMEPIKGTIMCFTEEFLSLAGEDLKQLPIIRNRFNGHELDLTADDLLFIDDILHKTYIEFKKNNEWKNGMLYAYLRILIIYLSRLYLQQVENAAPTVERRTLKHFQELINEQYRELHDVASYAAQLHITPGHLGEVVKQQSGKSAIELIHDRLMIESRRLLFHTEQSVKEIAFDLGFSDVSYFVRFFKRLATETPISYREQVRKMYHPNL